MNSVAIVDELTFNVEQMMNETLPISDHIIVQIQKHPKIDPSTFDWSSIHPYDTWFACLNSTINKVYYFPMGEWENRDNNYSRAKHGIAYFISQGWEAYQIQ